MPSFKTNKLGVIQLALADGDEGNIVTQAQFGVNLLFDRDDNCNDSTGMSVNENYAQAVRELHAASFRYPGGVVSEALFDLRNPDNPVQDGNWQDANYNAFDADFGGPLGPSCLTLTGALEYARQSGMSMTFVMPSIRFIGDAMDANGHRYADVDEALVRKFVTDLLDDALARGVHLEAFEIGNEWYGDYTAILGTTLTPVEYGRIASAMAAIMQDCINDWRADHNLPADWQEPGIAIQVGHGGAGETFMANGHELEAGYTGPTKSATQLIFEQFDTAEERGAIDGLIRHRYLGGTLDGVNGWAYSPFDKFEQLAQQTGGFGDLERYVTEWNIYNGNVELIDHFHAAGMVALFAEMVDAGVDHAYVWPVQQNNLSRLTRNAGFAGEAYKGLSPGGEVFRMMATALPGLTHVHNSDNFGEVRIETFVSDDQGVGYFANVSEEIVTFSFNASALLDGSTHAWVSLLYGPPHVANDPVKVQIMAESQILVDGMIELKLKPGEVAQVSLSFGRPVDIQGQWQRDTMTGTAFNDTLRGEGGIDRMSGEGGNDLVFGGAGGDQLKGNAGNDTIGGDGGDDWLFGGCNDDVLDGDGGDDTLDGGTNDDLINGGTGNDVLTGGTGADIFVFSNNFNNDRITDFNVAETGEVIDLRDVTTIRDFDRLVERFLSENADGDAVITVGANSIVLEGVDAASLTAGDFLF